jgi:AcrR family transcriptional regulator
MGTSERRGALRETLIEAAEQAIALGGLTQLKARDLARAAGCALGAIYTVFPDLDALILAVNARTLDHIDRAMRAPDAVRNTPMDAEHAIARLVELATSYLDFAVAQTGLWRALFEHRLPAGQTVPADYLAQQMALFRHIVAPLEALQPDMNERARLMLARSLFSAVHGVVDLGLEEKLTAVPLPELRRLVVLLATAMGRGLLQVGSARGAKGAKPRRRP